jgi:hypothetical protein
MFVVVDLDLHGCVFDISLMMLIKIFRMKEFEIYDFNIEGGCAIFATCVLLASRVYVCVCAQVGCSVVCN